MAMNIHLVGAGQGGVVIQNPPSPRQVMSEEQALELAAWLVVCCACDIKRFHEVYLDVCKS